MLCYDRRNIHQQIEPVQGCVFTKDVNKAILISDAMETGTVQINSAPARGPDHFPFQVNPVKNEPKSHNSQLLFPKYRTYEIVYPNVRAIINKKNTV